MTPTAITLLVVAALIIWGGLALSILRLRRDAAQESDEPHDPGRHATDSAPMSPPPGGARTPDASAD